MIARIYFSGKLLLQAPLDTDGLPRKPSVADDISLVLIPEHPRPDDRAVVLEGKLQSA